jgi:DNA gyrase subunit A
MTDNSSQSSAEIIPVPIETELKQSYLSYAMSVIVSRALPDVRDGLKPVHRRILYGMAEGGYTSDKTHRKSSRVVGDVLGKYHPHSDDPIYQSMVRMGQNFSMRLMLIDGHGNFGSIDGDKPAAQRYTEARLAKVSDACILLDYDKDTVDFEPNYDGTLEEPLVLPARFPNLLVNGAGGIAVGMATNIPPHNLGEVIDACCALIDRPHLTVDEILEYLPGPDFPTGGLILGHRGIRNAYETGRGSVIMRGCTHLEEVRKDRQAIIVTEIPYQVQKARMIEHIAGLVNAKELDGISDIRDESDRDGIRVVIELKRDAHPEVVLNRLYSMTQLQTSFAVNMLALNGRRPQQMGVKEVLELFLQFREDVVIRRTRYYLTKARARAHILIGLLVSVLNIDTVVALIRGSRDPQEAKEKLLERAWELTHIKPYLDLLGEGENQITDGGYRLSEEQAKAILDLKLQRLTGLERKRLEEEYKALAEDIREYLALLSSRPKLLELIKTEFQEVKDKFADPRRTRILEEEANQSIEDLIEREDMIVTFSLKGYIKRVPLTAYRAQRRGGRGKAAMSTREEDVVFEGFTANTHTPLLFFSTAGKAYQLKVYELPLGTPQSRGKPVINVLSNLDTGEHIATLLPVPEDPEAWRDYSILFVTSRGHVRRNALSDFQNIRSNGKIAIKLEKAGEKLIAVKVCNVDQDVLLTTQSGRAIRFSVSDVREFSSRTSTGVRGIRLKSGDQVVSATILEGTQFTMDEREAYLKEATKRRRLEGQDDAGEDEESIVGITPLTLSEERFAEMQATEELILTVSTCGYGKRTSAYAYRKTARGGQGIATLDVNMKTGNVVDAFPVAQEDEVMLVTDRGQLVRFAVKEVRIAGRKTQGVTLFRLTAGEKVVSVVRIQEVEDAEEESGKE